MVDYSPPFVDFKKVRKSRTIPDQSLSIQEIVKRYVRGVPVDVVQRDGVFVDQNDHDFEKLSRMDFGEKAEFAKSEADRLKQWRSDLEEAEATKRSEREAIAKAESDAKAAAGKAGVIVGP